MAKECEGFCAAEVPESPKFHNHPLMLPEAMVDPSVKLSVILKQLFDRLKAGTGFGFTTTVLVVLSIHPSAVVALSFTIYDPAAA